MPLSRRAYRISSGDKRYNSGLGAGQGQPPQNGATIVVETPAELKVRIETASDIDEIRALCQKVRTCGVELQEMYIESSVQKTFGFKPRTAQVRALSIIIFKREDLILTARTSFGKSLILQAPSIFQSGSIAIILLPLTKIGEEQCEKLRRLDRANPCLISGDTLRGDDQLLKRVRRGEFSHVLLSPEQALKDEFSDILRDPVFRARVCLVAVDEAHLIEQWGNDFRRQYAYISSMRAKLPDDVPWFACSATLSRDTLRAIKTGLQFHEDVRHIRTSVDRPEITIIVQRMRRNGMGSFESLYFVLDCANNLERPTPNHIPKTVVFIDNKDKIHDAAEQLRTWLVMMAYTPQLALETVQTYHSDSPPYDKERIYTEFGKETSSIRIVVCSEALGMGIDILDIVRVVLYGLPRSPSLAVLWQRAGRAVRKPGLDGEVVFLVENWVFGERDQGSLQKKAAIQEKRTIGPSQLSQVQHVDEPSSPLTQVRLVDDLCSQHSNSDGESDVDPSSAAEDQEETEDVTNTRPSGRQGRTDRQRRAELPEHLYQFANSTSCYRKHVLKYFDDQSDEDIVSRVGPRLCCNVCAPALKRYSRPPQHSSLRRPRADHMKGVFLSLLWKWVQTKAIGLVEHPHTLPFVVPGDYFMRETIAISLAHSSETIVAIEDMRSVLANRWVLLDQHQSELFDKILEIRSQALLKYSTIRAEIRAKRDNRTKSNATNSGSPVNGPDLGLSKEVRPSSPGIIPSGTNIPRVEPTASRSFEESWGEFNSQQGTQARTIDEETPNTDSRRSCDRTDLELSSVTQASTELNSESQTQSSQMSDKNESVKRRKLNAVAKQGRSQKGQRPDFIQILPAKGNGLAKLNERRKALADITNVVTLPQSSRSGRLVKPTEKVRAQASSGLKVRR